MKLVLWTIVVVLVVMWLMRGKKTASSTSSTASAASAAPTRGQPDATEPMLQCAHCHVHFPASEAATSTTGVVYCSEEHRVLHGKR